MLSAETQKKVQILGSSFHKELHAVVAPENLLPDFGGTSSGRLADSVGPWIPILEKMRVEHEAAAAAIAAAEEGGAAEGGAQQASPGGPDVRPRDTDHHVAAGGSQQQQQVHATAQWRRSQVRRRASFALFVC